MANPQVNVISEQERGEKGFLRSDKAKVGAVVRACLRVIGPFVPQKST